MDAEYLKRKVGDALARAIAEINLVHPADPVEYLSQWLYQHKANEVATAQSRADAKKLEQERAVAERGRRTLQAIHHLETTVAHRTERASHADETCRRQRNYQRSQEYIIRTKRRLAEYRRQEANQEIDPVPLVQREYDLVTHDLGRLDKETLAELKLADESDFEEPMVQTVRGVLYVLGYEQELVDEWEDCQRVVAHPNFIQTLTRCDATQSGRCLQRAAHVTAGLDRTRILSCGLFPTMLLRYLDASAAVYNRRCEAERHEDEALEKSTLETRDAAAAATVEAETLVQEKRQKMEEVQKTKWSMKALGGGGKAEGEEDVEEDEECEDEAAPDEEEQARLEETETELEVLKEEMEELTKQLEEHKRKLTASERHLVAVRERLALSVAVIAIGKDDNNEEDEDRGAGTEEDDDDEEALFKKDSPDIEGLLHVRPLMDSCEIAPEAQTAPISLRVTWASRKKTHDGSDEHGAHESLTHSWTAARQRLEEEEAQKSENGEKGEGESLRARVQLVPMVVLCDQMGAVVDTLQASSSPSSACYDSSESVSLREVDSRSQQLCVDMHLSRVPPSVRALLFGATLHDEHASMTTVHQLSVALMSAATTSSTVIVAQQAHVERDLAVRLDAREDADLEDQERASPPLKARDASGVLVGCLWRSPFDDDSWTYTALAELIAPRSGDPEGCAVVGRRALETLGVLDPLKTLGAQVAGNRMSLRRGETVGLHTGGRWALKTHYTAKEATQPEVVSSVVLYASADDPDQSGGLPDAVPLRRVGVVSAETPADERPPGVVYETLPESALETLSEFVTIDTEALADDVVSLVVAVHVVNSCTLRDISDVDAILEEWSAPPEPVDAKDVLPSSPVVAAKKPATPLVRAGSIVVADMITEEDEDEVDDNVNSNNGESDSAAVQEHTDRAGPNPSTAVQLARFSLASPRGVHDESGLVLLRLARDHTGEWLMTAIGVAMVGLTVHQSLQIIKKYKQ